MIKSVLHASERVRFINTVLQRGVRGRRCGGTASAVLFDGVETAEAVNASLPQFVTPLKQGVNEKRSNLAGNICISIRENSGELRKFFGTRPSRPRRVNLNKPEALADTRTGRSTALRPGWARSVSIALAVMIICLLAVAVQGKEMLDPKVHHLGTAGKPEWQEFIGKIPEGQRYDLRFNARTNRTENTLFIRQDDVKEEWSVELNGRKVGKLFQMEADLIQTLPLPPGSLHAGENTLSIIPAKTGDDIFVGEVWLDARPATEAVGLAVLSVDVTDLESKRGLPCRITVVNDSDTLMPLVAAPGQHLAVRPGVVYTSDGKASLRLAPGEYKVHATRGFEYGLASRRVHLRASEPTRVSMELRREVATPGLVSSDTHVHTFTLSRHGDATLEERAVTLAGEGIELPIATDHNILADYSEAMAATGTGKFFTPVVGCEVTTAKGHFNVFPIKLGSRVPNFQIEEWPPLMQSIRETPGVQVVILDHPRNIHSGFQPFAATNFNAVTGENRRGPEFSFDAVEVVNSSALQTDWMVNFRDWFALLNYGYNVTGVGSSDGHDVSRYIVGQGRSYVACDNSKPGEIDVEQACRSFREGRVLISLGLLTQLNVEAGGKQYGVGDLVPLAENVQVTVSVSAPSWVEADRIELYANGVQIKEHQAGKGARAVKLSQAEIARGVKLKAKWPLDRRWHDVYLVAIASGPGVREPYWATARPYQPSSPIWDSRVIGATNPIWMDGDGDGKFTPARAYAKNLVEQAGIAPDKVIPMLEGYDEAIAAHAASFCRAAGLDLRQGQFADQLGQASRAVQRGFESFRRSLEGAAVH